MCLLGIAPRKKATRGCVTIIGCSLYRIFRKVLRVKRKVNILLLLLVLGGRQVSALNLDIQAGVGWSFFGEEVIPEGIYEATYMGFTTFLGVGRSFFKDFLIFGGEYEINHEWAVRWRRSFEVQWEGPYLTQHSPKIYVKVRALDYVSITSTLGANVVFPYGSAGEFSQVYGAFNLGFRAQILSFYGQLDFSFYSKRRTSRIIIGVMTPSFGNLFSQIGNEK